VALRDDVAEGLTMKAHRAAGAVLLLGSLCAIVARSLDFGRNREVSMVNQLIVLLMATGCVVTTTRAFRFARDPIDG